MTIICLWGFILKTPNIKEGLLRLLLILQKCQEVLELFMKNDTALFIKLDGRSFEHPM